MKQDEIVWGKIEDFSRKVVGFDQPLTEYDPIDIFGERGSGVGGHTMVGCPVCKSEYKDYHPGDSHVHPVRVVICAGERSYDITGKGLDKGSYGNAHCEPSGDGVEIAIYYDCEQGHGFILKQAFHKGDLEVGLFGGKDNFTEIETIYHG
jgi:hypothetical protein